MKQGCVHVLGASGSGTTTLGRALATRLSCAHFDTDDFFWERTDPPFQEKTPVEARQAALRSALDGAGKWVLSGSLCGWGDVFIPQFDLVIFISLDQDVRMERLRRREIQRYGEAALAPGGVMHKTYVDFIEWAAAYDTAGMSQRSRLVHETWLADMPVPVIRLDGAMATDEQVESVIAFSGR